MKTKTFYPEHSNLRTLVIIVLYAIILFPVADASAQGRFYKVAPHHGLTAGLITGQYDAAVSDQQPTDAITTSTTHTLPTNVQVSTAPKCDIPETGVGSVNINGKVFFQDGENSYKYKDGKKIGGDVNLVAHLSSGKPITEATYYFELKKADYMKGISLREFGKCDFQQKQRLVNNVIASSN